MTQASLFDMAPPTLSVSQITAHIRQMFDVDDVLPDVWLEGEISNWRPAASGHIYFTMKDDGAGIRCVIWRSTRRRLAYLPRQDGEAIVAHGRVSVYEAGGTYQFYVDEVKPAGKGALYLQFEQLKQQLAAEGLFDAERKQPLPPFPRRIGIVTSAKAAALKDILNVLSRRYPLAEAILSPTPVQGADAPPQIIKALRALLALQPPVDVILLARGGGSIEDLWAFNDEALARFVADCPLPVVTGVGHETDFTIVDFVADRRAPTPSAAAEVAAPDIDELRGRLAGFRLQFTTSAQKQLDEAKAGLQEAALSLRQLSPQTQIDNYRQQIDERLNAVKSAVGHALALRREQFAGVTARLHTLNPQATLARGYAIVQKAERVVSSVGDVSGGDRLSIIVKDGSFTVNVEDA